MLYTETGAFNVRVAGTRTPQEMVSVLVAASLVVFVGFLGSLVLPLRVHRFPDGKFADATPALQSLSDQLLMGATIFVAASAVALGLYTWAVWPNLVSIHNLVKDCFIYTMVGVIYYQGLVAYVRYVTFLYRTHMDNSMKVIVSEVCLGMLTLVLGLYLLTLDVLSLARVPDPTGLTGLHVVTRDVWMTIIILVAYGWHLKRVADH